MPSKKKKYNARFPPARIKKIMQTDDDVGKVAAAVPVIISRALELFIESLIVKTCDVTKAKNAKTLTTQHVKHIVETEKNFDFLKDLVANVPDVQPNEDEGTSSGPLNNINQSPEKSTIPRPRGRPRKKKLEPETLPPKKRIKYETPAESEDSSATEDADTDFGDEDSADNSLPHDTAAIPSTSGQYNKTVQDHDSTNSITSASSPVSDCPSSFDTPQPGLVCPHAAMEGMPTYTANQGPHHPPIPAHMAANSCPAMRMSMPVPMGPGYHRFLPPGAAMAAQYHSPPSLTRMVTPPVFSQATDDDYDS